MPNWKTVLGEISNEQQRAAFAQSSAFDTIRRKYLNSLSDYTNRNVIAYYSGWQSKPGISGVEIRDEDKNGFMAAVHEMDTSRGLDLILHTPGGSISATHSIVTYLRDKFGRDIRAIVPHTAMSAGTMMACSCKEILMAKHSSIGPIDPQLRGVPAHGVLAEIRSAYRDILKNPARQAIWQPILEKYTPTFIGQCRNAIRWSEDFSREQLASNMFHKAQNKDEKINRIILSLTDYNLVKLHERQIGYKEAKKIGLKISLIEADQQLQDLVLTVHHCYQHTLSNTQAFKIIENQKGAAFVKMASN